MPLLLLREPLLKLLVEGLEIHVRDLLPLRLGEFARELRIAQPGEQLVGEIELPIDPFKELGEGPIVGVEEALPLHHHRPREVVEDAEAGPRVTAGEGLHQREPLGRRHADAVAPQVVEEVDEHGSEAGSTRP